MASDQIELSVHLPDVALAAFLGVPPGAAGIIAFAHGSGSGRFSERNQFVAGILRDAGLGTLLLDLLTAREEAIDNRTMELRFDVGLLARRVVGAVDWLARDPSMRDLPLGVFGASTGAAAALIAAAERPQVVRAVVSRGGRPDLAADALPLVQAPTLLIVGGEDHQVLALNRDACDRLRCDKRLQIVPGATHLFEEPGTLDQAAHEARDWFLQCLAPAPAVAEES